MAPDFGKQIGPLPLGAWVAVVGGGLAIAWYSRRNSGGSSAPTVVDDTSGVPGVGTGAQSMWTQLSPPADVSTGSAPTTNEEWGRQALNYLIAQGYDAAVADSAVRKYLESTALSLQENILIKFALVKLGAPPVPLPAPPPLPTVPVSQPPPTPAQPSTAPPPSASLRYVTVGQGDTLNKLALKWYGRAASWTDILNANRKGYTRPDNSPGFISNPNYLRPGDRLWLPGTGGPVR